MGEGIRWVGLDVHASRTAVAVLDTATGEVLKRTVHGRPSAVMELLGALDGPVHATTRRGRLAMGWRGGRGRGLRSRSARRG